MKMVKEQTLVEKLMAIAGEELKARLPENEFADDWQWNPDTTCFQFIICTCKEGKEPWNWPTTDPYRFCYDPDERTWGTAEEQLAEWLDRWF